MDHSCWFLLGSWKYVPTAWRESKIWDSLCQHLSDQSQSCGFLFSLNPRRFPCWIHGNALGSKLEPGFLQPAKLHFSHLTVPSDESVQHRQQARGADGINRGFLPARKQMLVLEMKYCHGKDSWGIPAAPRCWLRSEQRAKDWEHKARAKFLSRTGKETLDGLPGTWQETSKKSKYSPSRLQVWVSPAGPMVPSRKSGVLWEVAQSCPMSWILGEKISLEPRAWETLSVGSKAKSSWSPNPLFQSSHHWEGHVVKPLH